MGTTSKQVMDIKVTKGISQIGNEELRDWTDKGWDQAMREGNYDRSREHLNFEIQKGGIVTPIDKNHSLTKRMAENLASRGIKDPNGTCRASLSYSSEFHLWRLDGANA